MATYYVNLTNAYYLADTVGASNVGTTANAFNYQQLRLLLKGTAVNGYNITHNDTIRITGFVSDDGTTKFRTIFNDFRYYGLKFESWEDGAPWGVYNDTVNDNEFSILTGIGTNPLTTITNAVFSGNFRLESPSTIPTYIFKNCIFYDDPYYQAGLNTYGHIQFLGCSFARSNFEGRGGSGSGVNATLRFECCYFEACGITTNTAWGTAKSLVTVTSCIFTLSSATANALFASGTTISATGNTYSNPLSTALPAMLSLSQSNLEFFDYDVPISGDNSLFVAGSYTLGFYVTSRIACGAFNFDISAAISASPTSGKAPLEVEFTSNSASDIKQEWDFGDGFSTSGSNPTHTFKMPGQYTVTLTVTGSSGITATSTIIIYVYDWDYSGTGIHVAVTDACLRFAIKPSQGIGWSEYTGDDWLFPGAYHDTLVIYNDIDEPIQLVWDQTDGLPYQIGLLDQWLDKEDDYGGTEIQSAVRPKEHRGSTEHYMLEPMEEHAYFRPDSEDNKNKLGYNEFGYRDGFEVSIAAYLDGEQDTPNAITRDVPIDGDITYDRKVEAHRVQLEYRTTTSEWKLLQMRSYYIAKDKTAIPDLAVMTEHDQQEDISNMIFWVTRGDTQLLDRISNSNVSGSITAAIDGPDGESGSAMNQANINIALSSSLSDDFTLIAWIRSDPTTNIMSFSTGGGVLSVDTGPVVRFNDGANTHSFALTWDPSDWILITVVRDGNMLSFYANKTLLGTIVLTNYATYGGTLTCNSGSGDFFDLRVLNAAIEAAALRYYYDDIVNNSGNALLPIY